MSDMMDDLDFEATGRCPPYSDLLIAARFSAPHLALLVLSTEDVSSLFPGDPVVLSPPTASPFYDWMVTGVPATFVGTIIHSMVFYRHLSHPNAAYKPQFFARAVSSGVPPFLISMGHEWFTAACDHASRPALGHSVVHVHSGQVQSVLNAGGHAPPGWETSPDWLYEVLTKQLLISGRRVNRQQLANMDFLTPSS